MATRLTITKILISVFSLCQLKADLYEGVDLFSGYQKLDIIIIPQFLPYNPVILEAGAFYGAETTRMAQLWPRSKVYAFEPNPQAYDELRKNIAEQSLNNISTFKVALSNYNGVAPLYVCRGMHGVDNAFGYASSLLPATKEMEIYCKGPRIEVPCVILDDWCWQNQVDHIDLLRLELEGKELPVLKSSPNILKTVKVIYVKTTIHPYRKGMTQYPELKSFLEQSNFVLLSHLYVPGITGYAIFLSREIFDAYFKKSLGIYLGV
jgi:FkbM family methyltransferase